MLSRIAGIARDAVLAAVFGTGQAMNAFSVAFRLPNLFRGLLGEGALSVAFIPVLTSLIENKDEAGAQRLSNLMLTVLVTLLAAVVLVGEGVVLVMAAVMDLNPQLELTLGLTAVLLPFLIATCLVALFQAMLNVRGHFAMPAAAPIVLNLFIVAGAFATLPLWGDDLAARIYGVAAFILLAGLVEVAIQVPVLRRHGFRFRAVWDTSSPHLRRIGLLMIPMMIGLGIVQVNTFVDQVIAMGFCQYVDAAGNLVTHLDLFGYAVAYPMERNAPSVMYYSQQLYHLPFGVFIVAIGTVIFPVLARHAHHQDHAGLAETFNRGLRLATFIALPCSVGMILVCVPLVRAYLQHREFSAADTADVALMTAVYVSGLVSFAVVHLATRTFYARQETMTPVKTAVASAVANFLLNITLIWFCGIAGLAIATVISSTAQALMLVWILRRRIGRLGGRRYLVTLGKSLVASAFMGAAAWGAMQLTGRLGLQPESLPADAVTLTAAVVVGAAAYFLAAKCLRMDELADALSRRRKTETQP
jgi:putative peptidoglycan lipid II flippase